VTNVTVDFGRAALPGRVIASYAAVMSLQTVVLIAWLVFVAVWLLASFGVKRGSRGAGSVWPRLIAITAFVVVRFVKPESLKVHGVVWHAVGAGLTIAGISLAIWARFYLGRNWGMPMSQKNDPELVTSGPYRFVRHPIYSGILLAAVGTALVTTLWVLVGAVALAGLFVYSARVEEKTMSSSFPDAYRSYRARTKMLIPFVL
jgi:protein-S-isoprenylcysteine O-methyltransferase Ste14